MVDLKPRLATSDIQVGHAVKPDLKCIHCGMQFETKIGLGDHLLIHSKAKRAGENVQDNSTEETPLKLSRIKMWLSIVSYYIKLEGI